MQDKKLQDPIQNIINNSGNDFHLKVAKILKEKDWEIRISPHYNDPSTDIPREIDIIAEKDFDSTFDKSGTITVRLFIECKYIKNNHVFWFLEKNNEKAKALVKNNSILYKKPDPYLNFKNKVHHYIKDNEVAKEHSSDNQNQQLHKAINQVLNATLFFKNHQTINRYTVDFPIIITNSFDLFKKKNDTELGYEQIDDIFQIEVDYTYQNKEEYFLIDIISEEKINQFFEQLTENDIYILKRVLSWDIDQRKREREMNNRNRGR